MIRTISQIIKWFEGYKSSWGDITVVIEKDGECFPLDSTFVSSMGHGKGSLTPYLVCKIDWGYKIGMMAVDKDVEEKGTVDLVRKIDDVINELSICRKHGNLPVAIAGESEDYGYDVAIVVDGSRVTLRPLESIKYSRGIPFMPAKSRGILKKDNLFRITVEGVTKIGGIDFIKVVYKSQKLISIDDDKNLVEECLKVRNEFLDKFPDADPLLGMEMVHEVKSLPERASDEEYTYEVDKVETSETDRELLTNVMYLMDLIHIGKFKIEADPSLSGEEYKMYNDKLVDLIRNIRHGISIKTDDIRFDDIPF